MALFRGKGHAGGTSLAYLFDLQGKNTHPLLFKLKMALFGTQHHALSNSYEQLS